MGTLHFHSYTNIHTNAVDQCTLVYTLTLRPIGLKNEYTTTWIPLSVPFVFFALAIPCIIQYLSVSEQVISIPFAYHPLRHVLTQNSGVQTSLSSLSSRYPISLTSCLANASPTAFRSISNLRSNVRNDLTMTLKKHAESVIIAIGPLHLLILDSSSLIANMESKQSANE